MRTWSCGRCASKATAPASDIARALKAITRVPGVDVVIVGRGGGSIEDLWAFNEEILARAIAASPVPIISAVGHEVDVTIADFVADLRAPTPSAAAEMVVTAKEEFSARIDRLQGRLEAAMRGRYPAPAPGPARPDQPPRACRLAGAGGDAGPAHLGADARVAAGRHRAGRAARARTSAACGAARSPRRAPQPGGRPIAPRRRRTAAAATGARAIERAQARLATVAGRLESLSPLGVLARGYAVCWNSQRTAIIRDSDTVGPGDRVRVTLHEGELDCEVRGTHGSDH